MAAVKDDGPGRRHIITDKETDESWDICTYNMKNQFWAGLGSRAVLVKKKFEANYVT